MRDCSQAKQRNRIAQQPVFGDFGISGTAFALWQGFQCRCICQHGARLIESPDQVFADTGIDACLAADGTVNLSQQGCRHLNEINAAQQAGGSKPHQITNNAAANSDKNNPPVNTETKQVFHQTGILVSDFVASPPGRLR